MLPERVGVDVDFDVVRNEMLREVEVGAWAIEDSICELAEPKEHENVIYIVRLYFIVNYRIN